MTLATTTTTADENVKKTLTLHVHHAFLYITFAFLCITAQLRRGNA